MPNIADNLAAVQERIAAACDRAERAPEDVQLVAVGKKFPAPTIREAAEAGLTVFGDLTIDGPDAELRPLSNVDDNEVGLGLIYHRLTVHGSIDNSTGGTFDMRRGSTSTTPQDASFIDLVFAGDQDATLELGPYDSNTNQLFRTEIAKEGGATVTMLSDATVDNNSLATFTLTSGYLDTGDYKFELISNFS